MRAKRVVGDPRGDVVRFWCPGCERSHMVGVWAGGWRFNGDFDHPTFSPSILVNATQLTDKGEAEIDAWRNAGYPKRTAPFDSTPTVCHSFVTDGRIQFLNDCTHRLVGQTVDLPNLVVIDED